ncbi:MAG: PAS domain-containing protein [Sulfurimonas sp.]|jgi:PAS domain S-box-containing protein
MNNKLLINLSANCYWNPDARIVIDHDKVIVLTASMTRLLNYLVNNFDKSVHSIDIFLDVFYEYDKEFKAKIIRNMISDLRKKVPCLEISNFYGGLYMLRKFHEDTSEFQKYLLDILDQAKNGITITDPNLPDNPIIYVNQAFSDLFGYTRDEVIHKNCRFLQGDDREQLGLDEIRRAIAEQTNVTVTLRNYDKDGHIVYNEITISPIFDKETGKLRYFLGVQKDVSRVSRLMQQIKGIV